MSRIHARLAPSYLALMMAAGFAAAPAMAATTTVTVAEGATQTTAITASPAAGDTVIVEIDGTLRGSSATAVNSIVLQGSGAGSVVVNNDGRIQGRFNFPSATGPITVNNNTGADPLTEGWHTSGTTTFGAGADAINNAETGVIATQGTTSFAFGAGADSFTNAGRLIVDRQGTVNATLTITGLETFNNSGAILLGSAFSAVGNEGLISDGFFGDRLVAQGVAFTGSEGSRIAMDVAFTASQTDCATLTAADCADFTGGSTAGSTLLTVREAVSAVGDAALGATITLIAGSSAAEHFSLDPKSDHYTIQSFGPALQKGLVAFSLVYDADTEQHRLVSVLADEAVRSPTLVAPAQDTWRATASAWFVRQADLRTSGGYEESSGVWGRIGGGVAERELLATVDAGGLTTGYDLGYEQSTGHLVFGADLLRGGGEAAWVLGAALGFVRTDVKHDASETDYSGFTGGFYGSYLTGPLFVDALFNANLLDVATDAPRLGLNDNVKLKNRVKSLGGQLEAGWRLDLGSGFVVEPLAGLSYVKSQFEDADMPDGSGGFDFEDSYTSFRIGAGLRLGLQSEVMGVRTSYSIAGRYWDEQEAENASAVTIANGDSSVALVDSFSGGFSEVTGSVSLSSPGGGLAAFAQAGGEFGDDYEAFDGAIGVRLRW